MAEQEKPGVIILPLPVIEITGKEHEGHLFLDGEGDEIFQRLPGGSAKDIHRGPFITGQTRQGAVQMDIGGNDKFKVHIFPLFLFLLVQQHPCVLTYG